MSAYDAQRQFDDNVKNFADTPEKQNLYNGLGNLALELQRVSAELHRIEQMVQQIQQQQRRG